MNKKSVLIASVLSLIVACGDGEDRQQKYLERAQQFLADENFDKARIDARNVLQINPKNSEARIILGEIGFQEGDIRKAYSMYQSVIDEDPTSVGAYEGIVKVFIVVKDFERANENADKALEIEPTNVALMGHKAVALSGAGEAEAAESLALETLSLDAGNSSALGVMIGLFAQREDMQAGLDLLNKGIKVNPQEDRLRMMKIAVLENMGDNAGLEVELVALVEKHPDSENYFGTLIRYYIRETRFDDAEKVVRAFATNNPDSISAKRRVIGFLQQHRSQEAALEQSQAYIAEDPDQSELYTTLAGLYLFIGEKERGIEVLQQAVDRDPRSVGAIEARNVLGALYLQDEDLVAAREIFEEVLAIEPENEDALLTRAGLNLNDGELKEGIADLRVVLKNNPDNAGALQSLAKAQEAAGDESLALDNLKKLLTLQQPTVETLTSAARLAIKSEQYKLAETFIRQALEIDSENTGLVTNLIKLLVLKEDWDAASKFAQRMIDSEDSKALGYFLQSGLNLRLEEFDEAIANLEQSLVQQPAAVESLSSMVQVLSQEKGLDAAIAYINGHCEQYPEQAHCGYIAGTLYAQNQDFERAEAELNRAITLDEKFKTAYRQLAKVYASQQQLEKTEDALARGIAATDSKPLRFELAGVYYSTGKYEQARDMYEGLVADDEDALAAKNNLAMIYAENLSSPENLAKARALAADLQDSDNPAFLDTVGWVMYMNGDYEQAITYSLAAVDKVGTSTLLQYHLGMAYYKSGDLEKAKTHLELATQTPDILYPGLEEAQATLQQL